MMNYTLPTYPSSIKKRRDIAKSLNESSLIKVGVEFHVTPDGKTVYNQYGRIMKQFKNYRGYPCVSFWNNEIKKTKTIAVHRLVALEYVPNYDELFTVNHKDGNKENNHFTNLEWSSIRDNIFHGYTLDTCPEKRKNTQPLSDDDIRQIRKIYADKEMGYRKLGKLYNRDFQAIKDIIQRITYKDVL